MTPQQLVGTAVRLFAVWLALSSVGYFSAIPTALAGSPMGEGNSVRIAYVIGGAYVVGALVLWFFPMLIAHRLVPRTQHENRLSIQAYELARVGCSLLGLWLLAKALPTLIWFIFRAFVVVDSTSSFSALAAETKVEVAVALFEVLFALVVIMKSRAFANLVTPGSPARAVPPAAPAIADDL